MFGVTSIFVNLSETMAELGFLVRDQHVKVYNLHEVASVEQRSICVEQRSESGRHALLLVLPSRHSCPMVSQAFSAEMVAFAGLYVRYRFTINPRAVYRQAMIRLNTHPGVLEVK